MGPRDLQGQTIAVVGGRCTPFLCSATGSGDLMAYELGAMAVSGLVQLAVTEPAVVDRVTVGIASPRASGCERRRR
jgi:hypothetical protein